MCVVRLSWTEQCVAYLQTSRLPGYDAVKREVYNYNYGNYTFLMTWESDREGRICKYLAEAAHIPLVGRRD